jgi:tetratricopeptide (TPR) repeat protein
VTRVRHTISALCGLGVAVLLLLGAAPPAAAQPVSVARLAQTLQRQMQRRGSAAGDIHLALAGLYARDTTHQREVMFHLAEARRNGVDAGRADLLLGTYYRSLGRYDAALSTFVRVLVRHEDQPYALVQLWKTLYECQLQGAPVKTDTDSIRVRLATAGLHFPQSFKLTAKSSPQAKKLTAAGYNALLGGKPEFAAGLFQAAIDAFPSEAQAHRGLGIARARMQDSGRAAGAYLLYLELAPQAPDADEVDRVLMEYWKNR